VKLVPRWLITLLRLTPVIGAACMLSILGLIAFRAMAPADILAAASSQLGNYLQTLGSIYAVLLAFVVYVVWGQFNDVRTYIDREASALVDVHRTASSLPKETRTAIQDGLRDYTDAVLRDEWLAMTHRDEAAIERTGEKLERVWLAMHVCKPCTDGQQTIYAEVITQFNQLMDLRTIRLSCARARVPLIMNILLYTGAFLVTGSIYLVDIQPFWLHAMVTAALAGAIAHVLYLIADLDDAFTGAGQVSKDPFERARQSFVRVSHLVDNFDHPEHPRFSSD
jgi:hypothetical protein